MPAACPGAHNNAWRRAEAELKTIGTPHDLKPTWGQPVHCNRCTDRARAQLAELPELVAAIWLEATHGSRGPKVGTIGRSAHRPPWPGEASRMLTDLIVGGLTELEDDIRDQRRLNHRPSRAGEGGTATGAVRFLTTHLDWALTEHPLAAESHERLSGNPASLIDQWHRAAMRFTARDARLEHRRVPCPRCELLTLFRAEGDDYIACRNVACELLLTPTELEDHVRFLAQQHAVKAVA
ncbi:hypothetical protein [Streptomyces sp. NPDC019937]|uniref:hypothetical protein n=1 Tax=Streptomyces sp. NPDC019937 TaxID=3154787 RepID=UPI0033E380D0